MTTPLILGNDFADQYSLSVKRMEGRTFLEFGDSGQSLNIVSSVASEIIDKGHTFKIQRLESVNKGLSKEISHHRNQQKRRKSKLQTTDQNIQFKIEVVIPAETCVTVPVLASFKDAATYLYVKKVFNSNRNLEDIYAALDSLITRENPILQVSNFSTTTVTIKLGKFWGGPETQITG